MTKPLALVAYERLLPGTRLCLKLGDLGYRVLQIKDLVQLVSTAERETPLVVAVDLVWKTRDACISINQLRTNEATRHLPVIAFADTKSKKLHENAIAAGADLVTGDGGVINQLEELLERVLDIE